jgi:flavin-dependent dehydrogenase
MGARRILLEDGSRVAVVGGGPAGSLFSFFLLDMAERSGVAVGVDMFESRDFEARGPAGCNMCGGILSEILVQNLALEGLSVPETVVQRGIDSYVLHTVDGRVSIETPVAEMRIGAVHRGAGPRDRTDSRWESLDRHLQSRALAHGAGLVNARVTAISATAESAVIAAKDGTVRSYDLAVVAAGVNSGLLDECASLGTGYRRPGVARTVIREYRLGEEAISSSLRNSMHVFLLDTSHVEFAAIIPKGDYATVCILGVGVCDAVVDAFLSSPVVKATMPSTWRPESFSCQCRPKINVRAARKPFADRLVFIGDSGATRLYKDGIGAAYRTAKAAARTAMFEGVSEDAFRRHYMPVCRSILRDNQVGKAVFGLTRLARRSSVIRRAMLEMAGSEQCKPSALRPMSGVLWDMFSGSATYSSIVRRMVRPQFVARFGAAAVRDLCAPHTAAAEVGHV